MMGTKRWRLPQQPIVRVATMLTIIASTMAAGTSCWGQTAADGASYPNRPLRLIAQFPPGSSTDIAARIVGQKLTEAWGQQVIVDNRAGAGGRIGTEIGAKATADGYTLTMSVAGPVSVAPALYPKLPYDVLRDFAPITNLATQAQVLLANGAVPAKTVAEMVELARSRPGAFDYASIGPGSFAHLAMELLQSATKIKLNHIPFKAGSVAHGDLISGQVQFMVDSLPSGLTVIRTGKIRGIAVTSLERQRIAAELPTIAESGYPGFEAIGWQGVLAPARTPPAILDKLNRELISIAGSAEMRERFEVLGFTTKTISRARYPEFIRAEIDKWKRVVRDAGIKVDD